MKHALSTGWLYLVVFIATVLFLVALIVPEELLPELPKQIVQKLGIKHLAFIRSDDNAPCDQLSEDACLRNMYRGCVPYYSQTGDAFLDCDICRDRVSCYSFGQEVACIANPCERDCLWVVGKYEGGYTIKGKCQPNEELTKLRRELATYGFNTTKLTFGAGLAVTRIEGGSCALFVTEKNDLVVLDKNHSIIYIKLHDELSVAYDNRGTLLENASVTCGGVSI